MLRHRAPRGTATIFACVLSYGVAQYVSILVIPLYLAAQGVSIVTLGFIVAVPGLLMTAARVPAGLLIDRWGARQVTISAAASLTTGSVFLAGALLEWLPLMPAVVCAQALFGAARGSFWPAIQTHITWWDYGTRESRFGTMSLIEGLGSVIGPALTGVVFAATGPTGTIATLGLLGALGTTLGLLMPETRPDTPRHSRATNRAAMKNVFRSRPVYVAAICNFGASLTMVTISSFLPVYLLAVGLPETIVGLLTSVRGFAMAFSGGLYARWFAGKPHARAWIAGMGCTALGYFIVPFSVELLPLSVGIALLGMGGGILQVLSVVVVADATPEGQLGLALGYSGTFRSGGVLLMPPILGAAVAAWGLVSSFLIPGALMLMAVAGTGPVLRWAQGGARKADPVVEGLPGD